MKFRRLFAMLMCLLLLVTAVGCSAAPGDLSAVPGHSNDSGKDAGGQLSGESSDNNIGSDVLTDRKLIRRIRTAAETEDMDALLENISARVALLGGYIESRNVQNGSKYA